MMKLNIKRNENNKMKSLDKLILSSYYLIIISITACTLTGSIYIVDRIIDRLEGVSLYTALTFTSILFMIVFLIIVSNLIVYFYKITIEKYMNAYKIYYKTFETEWYVEKLFKQFFCLILIIIIYIHIMLSIVLFY